MLEFHVIHTVVAEVFQPLPEHREGVLRIVPGHRDFLVGHNVLQAPVGELPTVGAGALVGQLGGQIAVEGLDFRLVALATSLGEALGKGFEFPVGRGGGDQVDPLLADRGIEPEGMVFGSRPVTVATHCVPP